jgi:ElaB/YqjD/DUF883 family membrane-anchored ribosome-binding protein
MKTDKAINSLTDQVEELLGLLELHPSPDLDAIRSRVEDAVDSVRVAINRSRVRARLKHYASSLDDYVTGYPRLGFVTGALLGAGLVYVFGRIRPGED